MFPHSETKFHPLIRRVYTLGSRGAQFEKKKGGKKGLGFWAPGRSKGGGPSREESRGSLRANETPARGACLPIMLSGFVFCSLVLCSVYCMAIVLAGIVLCSLVYGVLHVWFMHCMSCSLVWLSGCGCIACWIHPYMQLFRGLGRGPVDFLHWQCDVFW